MTGKKKAKELIEAKNFDGAGRVLDEVLASQVDELAETEFERGRVFELQFQPLQALPHYKKAYDFHSNSPEYGESYADLLLKESDWVNAEKVLTSVRQIRRDQQPGPAGVCG